MATLTQPTTAKTCADCPYFDPNQGRHGWCGIFNQGAKAYHRSTEICDQEVERLQKKEPQPKANSTATMAEWEEAARLMPKGYRTQDGWFHDSSGGRCNIPPANLTTRQVKIITGQIAVR